MKSFGYIESPFDNRDIFFKQSSPIEDQYKLENIGSVKDQGENPICAAISLSTMINWQLFVRGLKNNINYNHIFDLREDKTQNGMIPRDALKSLKTNGVDGYKINSFSRIKEIDSAKAAIYANGPLMSCFMAYEGDLFWKPNGNKLGGHAVVLTGWDNQGFILQNSWGTSWQSKGITILPFEDWKYVIESWTIMI